jgi:hypothetical protein
MAKAWCRALVKGKSQRSEDFESAAVAPMRQDHRVWESRWEPYRRIQIQKMSNRCSMEGTRWPSRSPKPAGLRLEELDNGSA